MKKINLKNTVTNEVFSFNKAVEAIETLRINKSNLYQLLAGKRKSVSDYILVPNDFDLNSEKNLKRKWEFIQNQAMNEKNLFMNNLNVFAKDKETCSVVVELVNPETNTYSIKEEIEKYISSDAFWTDPFESQYLNANTRKEIFYQISRYLLDLQEKVDFPEDLDKAYFDPYVARSAVTLWQNPEDNSYNLLGNSLKISHAAVVKHCISRISSSVNKISNFKLVTTDKNIPNIKYVELNDNKKLPASWGRYVNMLTTDKEKKVFLAQMYQILSGQKDHSQIMYIVGAANMGKSVLLEAIQTFLGTSICYQLNNNLEFGSHFVEENLINKHLVVVDDLLVVKSFISKLQSFVTGTSKTFDRKHLSAISAYVHPNIIIASNNLPEIDFYREEQQRRILIYNFSKVPVDDKRVCREDAVKQLVDDAEDFISFCKQFYEKEYDVVNQRIDNSHIPWKAFSSRESNRLSEILSTLVPCDEEVSSTKHFLGDVLIDILNVSKDSVHQKVNSWLRYNGYELLTDKACKNDIYYRLPVESNLFQERFVDTSAKINLNKYKK